MEIDAGAVEDERDFLVLAHEELCKNQVEDVDGVVAIACEDFGNLRGEIGNGPMRDGGGEGIKEALGEEAFPFGMVEGKDIDAAAEIFEDRLGVCAFAVFGEGEEVDSVIDCQTFKEMKSAMVSTAVERPWNVRVNSKYFHQL